MFALTSIWRNSKAGRSSRHGFTRIAVNEALKRLNARGKLDSLDKEQYGLFFQEMLRDFASVRSRYSDVNSLRGERRAGCKSIPR
jgi:hypothetical protein